MTSKPGTALFSVLVVTMLAACSGDDEGEAGAAVATLDPVVLTSLAAPQEMTSPTTTRPADDGAVPTTTSATTSGEPVLPGPPVYEVVTRSTGEAGDSVIVLLDPTSYTSLSDIDLENIVAEVYDRFSPVYEAHVVDDPSAAERLAREGPDAVAASPLADHYLVRLEEGFRIVFLGPYEEFGTATLGS